MAHKDIIEYTVDEICVWLVSIGLGKHAEKFRSDGVDGSKLASLAQEDLVGMGLSGLHSKKILRSFEKERSKCAEDNGGGSAGEQWEEIRSEVEDLKKLVAEQGKMIADQNREIMRLKAVRAPAAVAVAAPAPAPAPHTMAPLASIGGIRGGSPNCVTVPFAAKTVIEGYERQVVTFDLHPGQSVRAEPGSMVFMTEGVDFETHTGGAGLRRWVTGQKIFLTEFSYRGQPGTLGQVSFGSDFPCEILPLRLEDHGGCLVCQRGMLLCSAATVNIEIELVQSLGAGFFGGKGFILQRLSGSDYCFLNVFGCLIRRTLQPWETLRVTTGSIVAFERSVQYDVQFVGGGLKNLFFGGEGLFLTILRGPGTVWLESQSPDKMIAAIARVLECKGD